MTDELELKYAVDDAAALVAWLDEEFPIESRDAGWRTTRVTDRYFDTADRALERAGYGARLRRQTDSVVVNLKSDVETVDGLHHRIELEAEATDSLRPERWPHSEVREIVDRARGERPLTERFVLRQRRRVRTQRVDSGACLLSVDLVDVVVLGQQVGQLKELEVELAEGDESVLREMARRIEPSGLVRPEPRSKMAIAGLLTNR